MPHQNYLLRTALVCISISLFNAGLTTALASQETTADQAQAPSDMLHGKVTDIIEAAGYTYAEVDTGTMKVWAATTTIALKIGDTISFSTSMPMKNYHSNTIKRDFPLVYFSDRFMVDNASMTLTPSAIASPHEQISQHETVKSIKEFAKAEGGSTIAEVYADKDKLNGKTVHVRGQITKLTPNVMGTNWIHISDGSTQDDLTITTKNTAAMNDVVDVEGELHLDKDFGYGYVYPVIVENASVVKK